MLEAFELQISKYYPGFFIPELIKRKKKMRQIKFRVVHKVDNQISIIYNSDKYMINSNGILYEDYGSDKHPFWEIPFDSECVIQQFTGILDKNGKEIYEGDILTVYRLKYPEKMTTWYDKVENGLIHFSSLFSGFFIRYKGYDDVENFMDNNHRYEVIGNIFETPELIIGEM